MEPEMSIERIAIMVLLSQISAAAYAQRPDVRISTSAGTATDVAGISSSAVTIAPSAQFYPTGRSTLGIDASGTFFRGGGWSATLGSSLGARQVWGPAAIALNVAADYTGTSYDLAYATAAAQPALELRKGPLSIFAGGRASQARVFASESGLPLRGARPAAPEALLGGETISVRNGTVALYGGSLEMQGGGELVLLGLREERGLVADTMQIDQSVNLAVSSGAFTIGASGTLRQVAGRREKSGTAAMIIAITSSLTLEVAGGRYAANRLTGAAAGRFMSVGMSLSLAGRGPALPRPSGVASPRRGMTRVAIHLPRAQRVELAGDFNRWQPVGAQRAPNGVWYVDLAIAPGEYRYAFRVDGSEWRVPEGAPAADDEFGTRTAWLTVRSAPAGGISQ
jgi:hypothetical protein